MASEDVLLLGVALIVVLNRLYSHTGLRHVRLAYAGVQALNVAACIYLYVERIAGIAPRLDAGIRLFLIGFVTWHVASNFIAHGKRVRDARRNGAAAALEEEDPLDGEKGLVAGLPEDDSD